VTTDVSVAGWAVQRMVGDANCLHRRPLPEAPTRAVWVLDVVRPSLVLGSTQHDDIVDLDCARTWDVDVVRRRSGGGAVLVMPDDTLWVDVIVPAGDPLWRDDVAEAAYWLGDVWARTLDDLGVAATGQAVEVHHGALACGPLGRTVCFGAVGAGEVSVGGRKVVGISQRRTRQAARFQCAVYAAWDPMPIARLLRLDEHGLAYLADAVTGTGVPAATTLDAFLARLPA
jgi:lipoate-protein ligase A